MQACGVREASFSCVSFQEESDVTNYSDVMASKYYLSLGEDQ